MPSWLFDILHSLREGDLRCPFAWGRYSMDHLRGTAQTVKRLLVLLFRDDLDSKVSFIELLVEAVDILLLSVDDLVERFHLLTEGFVAFSERDLEATDSSITIDQLLYHIQHPKVHRLDLSSTPLQVRFVLLLMNHELLS